MISFRFLISSIVLVFGSSLTAQEPTIDFVHNHWQQYKARMHRCGFIDRTHSRYEITDHGDQYIQEQSFIMARSCYGMRLEAVPSTKNVATNIVYGLNEQYSFRLKWAPLSGNWLLDKLSMKDDYHRDLVNIQETSESALTLLQVDGSCVLDLHRRSSFIIESSTPDRCVLLAQNISVKNTRGTTFHRSIRLDTDPRHSFVIRKAVVEQKVNDAEGRLEATNTYRESDGLAIPITSVQEVGYTASSVRLVIKTQTTHEVELGVPLTVKDFTLSHYGFPEPPGVVWEKPTPRYVWLLAAAAALFIVGLVCRWALRRRQARLSTATPTGTPTPPPSAP